MDGRNLCLTFYEQCNKLLGASKSRKLYLKQPLMVTCRVQGLLALREEQCCVWTRLERRTFILKRRGNIFREHHGEELRDQCGGGTLLEINMKEEYHKRAEWGRN
jgi:hypothetical protein